MPLIARLDDETGRVAPGGAPLHDNLDGLEGHVPPATGRPAGLIPQTNGDGTYDMVPPVVDPWTAAGEILGATRVAPAAMTEYTAGGTVGGTDYSPAVLAVSFTVPESGKVLVHLEAAHTTSSAGVVSWMLRNSGVIVPGSVVGVASGPVQARTPVDILVVGLTPGQNLTWTWAGQTNGGAPVSTLRAGQGNAHGEVGAAIMVVRDAPF